MRSNSFLHLRALALNCAFPTGLANGVKLSGVHVTLAKAGL